MKVFEELKPAIVMAMNTGFVPEGNPDEALREIENLVALRQQALGGQIIDGESACKVLNKAYDHKSHLAYNGLFPVLQEGYFSSDDWRQIYLPYCHQLLAKIDACRAKGQDPLLSTEFREFTQITQRLMYTADEIPLTRERWQRWEFESRDLRRI